MTPTHAQTSFLIQQEACLASFGRSLPRLEVLRLGLSRHGASVLELLFRICKGYKHACIRSSIHPSGHTHISDMRSSLATKHVPVVYKLKIYPSMGSSARICQATNARRQEAHGTPLAVGRCLLNKKHLLQE